MVNHTRRYRGGEVSLPGIDKAVETANELVSQLKAIQSSTETNPYSSMDSAMGTSSVSESTPVTSSMDMDDYNSEPSVSESALDTSSSLSPPSSELAFKTDTNYKYSNPETSVKLSYPRIIMLLQKLIKQNPNSDRKQVLEKLQNATSQAEVQTIINDNKLRLASNYVMGGKTKKNKKTKGRKNKKSMRRR